MKRLIDWTSRRKLLLGLMGIWLAVVLWGPTVFVNLATRGERLDLGRTAVEKIPKKDVAMVFGAGVYADGTPTPYLKWRVETAVELYKAKRVRIILMTADNSSKHYNEPIAMQKYAMKLGVPKEDIVLDYAGFNTYDSCYRAQKIFKVKSAIVVTQGYHLPRAVFACQKLGTLSIGVNAIHTKGRSWGINYIVREWFSTNKITYQLLAKPLPTVLGNTEPIR